MHLRRWAVALLPCASHVVAKEYTDYEMELLEDWGEYTSDWTRNIRPTNITALYYDFYPWIGSYYNGTVSISMTIDDWTPDHHTDEDEKPCSALRDANFEFSFDALLAITKPDMNGDDVDNPIMLVCRSWEEGTDLLTNGDPLGVDTVSLNRFPWTFDFASVNGLPEAFSTPDDVEQQWDLSTKHESDRSYTFTGAKRIGHDFLSFRFNHTRCNGSDEESEFISTFTEPESFEYYNFDNLELTETPTINGKFDSDSASFDLEGTVSMHTKLINRTFGGQGKISFSGKIDANRSDELLPSRNDTPVWKATLGFSKDLFGLSPEGWPNTGNTLVTSCLYGLGVSVFTGCLLMLNPF